MNNRGIYGLKDNLFFLNSDLKGVVGSRIVLFFYIASINLFCYRRKDFVARLFVKCF